MSEIEEDEKPKGRPWISEDVKRALSRAFWRSIPILPGAQIIDLFNDLRRTGESVDEKIESALESLKNASKLIEELESSLAERTGKLNTLRKEVDRYSKLAKTEEDKAEAFIQQLDLTVGKGKGTERLISFGINLVAGLILFIAGLFLSPIITKWLGIGSQ